MSVWNQLSSIAFDTKAGMKLKLRKDGTLYDPDSPNAFVESDYQNLLTKESFDEYTKLRKLDKRPEANSVATVGLDLNKKSTVDEPTKPLTTIGLDNPYTQVGGSAVGTDGLTPNQQVQVGLRSDISAADGSMSATRRVVNMLDDNGAMPEDTRALLNGNKRELKQWAYDPTVKPVAGLGIGAATLSESSESNAADPDTEIAQTTFRLTGGDPKKTYEMLASQGGFTHQEITKALGDQFTSWEQQQLASGVDPNVIQAYKQQNLDYAPRAEKLFAPDMSVEALTAAIEKVNSKPFALTKTVQGFAGNVDAAKEMAEYSTQLSGVLTTELQNRGYAAKTDLHGDVVVQDPESGAWIPATGDFWRSLGESMYASKFEIGGAISGAIAGAKTGASLPIPHPIGKAVAGIAGGLIGGGVGAFSGSMADQYMSAAILKDKLDFNHALAVSQAAGVEDIMTGAIVGSVLKAGKETFNATMNVITRVKNATDNFMLQGALKELENISGLSQQDRERLISSLETVTQDRLVGIQAKKEVEAVLQTTPGMEILVGEASRLSESAGFNMLKSIDARAKDVISKMNDLTANNVSRVLIDELEGPNGYKAKTKQVYAGIKELGIRDADSVGFVYDPKTLEIPKMLEDAEAGITDPGLLSRFDGFVARLNSIGQDSGRQYGLGELLDTRRAMMDFRSNGFGNFIATSRIDRVISNIDDQINEAVKMMPNGTQWKAQFEKAKIEYSKMKALEENMLYKALTKDGATADATVKALSKYVNSVDGTFMQVLGKLPQDVRNNVEGAVIKKVAEKYTIGDASGYQAINFPKLAEALDQMPLTTEAARDLKRVVSKFAKVYLNDQALAKASGAIELPKDKSYLATSVTGRIDMAIHTEVFNYVSRYLPTQRGRTRRLAEVMGKVLDNPTNAKAINDMLGELPPDPELATSLRQLAITYAESGQKETYPKVQVYKVYTSGYSQQAGNTKFGQGFKLYTNEAEANAAKSTGQVVESIHVEPTRYATLDQAKVILGEEPTPNVLQNVRSVETLKRHGFLGVAEDKYVYEFK